MAEKNFNNFPDGVVPRRSPPRRQSPPRTPQDKCAVIRTLLHNSSGTNFQRISSRLSRSLTYYIWYWRSGRATISSVKCAFCRELNRTSDLCGSQGTSKWPRIGKRFRQKNPTVWRGVFGYIRTQLIIISVWKLYNDHWL